MTITLTPAARPIDATVELPGSKSYTNRALLIAALADGPSRISRALFSDDTHYMQQALTTLGIDVSADAGAATFVIEGGGGHIPATAAELFIGNAGTAARFLTAAVALGHGRYVVDGVARMRERPIEPLLDGLRQLGVDARSQFDNGCPPVLVQAAGMPGGPVRVRGDISSQYISALLLTGPYAVQGLHLEVEGELVSAPYLDMTAGIMADFGVEVEDDRGRAFHVRSGQRYRGRDYTVEPDASNASYFFAAAAVTGGRVRVPHLGRSSRQGDLGLLTVLAQMGCVVSWDDDGVEVRGPERLAGVTADFTRMGDVATTLAAIAPFADAPVTINGIAQTHFEECDRPVATATELRRMGIRVDETWDSLTIHPGEPQPATIETYGDHRMAMSFAITGLRAPGITIAGPECVAKTFPEFFTVLKRAAGG
ncbi:MAG: 3-phosphoshikimate 1-carboxyvinyltransferase [Dehalococcoidia bacterium]